MQTRLFTFILPHRASYFTDEVVGSDMLDIFKELDEFEDAKYDLIEAGNCFAAERFTACVYHLMRCAEYALVSVAAAANVPEDRRVSWDRMIQGIQTESNRLGSTTPANWRETQKKFADFGSWFTFMQKGWRNPASHVPRIYSESTSRGMFGAVHTLFKHMKAQGITPSPMPKDVIDLPRID